MLTIDEALEVQDRAAVAKVALSKRPVIYTVQSMLGGSFIGVAVILMLAAAGPFLAAGSPATKLVQGLVFGVALTLVFAAGGELVTSNMMTLTQGAFRRAITWAAGAGTMIFCFFANMLGAFGFAAMIHFSGLLDQSTPAGAMLGKILDGRAGTSTPQLFWRGVLCNMLVCLAMWAAVRLRSEGAKLFVIFWCLLAFITSGFEHVVANMTAYGIGLFGGMPETSWADFARNMTVVGVGNLVGGAVVVGLAYAISSTKLPEMTGAPAAHAVTGPVASDSSRTAAATAADVDGVRATPTVDDAGAGELVEVGAHD